MARIPEAFGALVPSMESICPYAVVQALRSYFMSVSDDQIWVADRQSEVYDL